MDLAELNKELKLLESQYADLLDKCQPNPQICSMIQNVVQDRIALDPMVMNSLYPNGINKKQMQEFQTKAIDSQKNKENRMHPFGHAELKDQLEDLEKFEEQMRRTTRGKSIRQSVGGESNRRSLPDSNMHPDKACCLIF
ncbi:UNKNOWN [Stylonychia lemnae]|uniref:Uncharacterized protein n=1 Tax=Stylonychia lemnae TaxID=5949 RepID=A0A077ZTU2_STYLE|nr:UNKNOWN [Stylonychia lemnae]|eukprot:CDW71861.1 UNKNOWN [Stylonychia lemnae]